MKRRLTISAVALAAGVCLVLAASAEASERSRFEIFFRGGISPSSGGTAYFHEYDPNPGYTIAGSFFRQTLSIDLLAGWGAQVGATVFFGGAWGVRFSLGREEHALAGAPSSYDMKFLHTDYMPWLDQPQVDSVYERSLAWPGASGRLGRTTAALEVVVRIKAGPGLSLDLSAGPLLSFWAGSLQSLAYTELVYSRFGALIFHDSFLRLCLPSRVRLGMTAGAEARIRILEGMALLINATIRSARYEATPVVAEAYDGFAFLLEDAERLTRIKSRIAPAPLALAMSPFIFGGGVSVSF